MKSESLILNEILALSDGRELMLWRQQSGIFYTRHGSPVRIGVNGMPDVSGEFMGRAFWVEVKNERGTLRDEQRNFIKQALARGTMAFCARSASRVLTMLRGPAGWQDTELCANVARPVFEWGPAKYYKQTGNENPTPGEYLEWLEGICGL